LVAFFHANKDVMKRVVSSATPIVGGAGTEGDCQRQGCWVVTLPKTVTAEIYENRGTFGSELFNEILEQDRERPILASFRERQEGEWEITHIGPGGEIGREYRQERAKAFESMRELREEAERQAAIQAAMNAAKAQVRANAAVAPSKWAGGPPRQPGSRKRRSTQPDIEPDAEPEEAAKELSANLVLIDASPGSEFKISKIEFKEVYADNEEVHTIDFERRAFIPDPDKQGCQLTAEFEEDGNFVPATIMQPEGEEEEEDEIETLTIVLRPRNN